MPDLRPFGKIFVLTGALLLILGGIFLWNPRFPAWLGHLPGDIAVKKKNVSFYFPVTTCLLASALLSLILWLFTKK